MSHTPGPILQQKKRQGPPVFHVPVEHCILHLNIYLRIEVEAERDYEDINLWQSEQIVFCTPGTI